MWWSDRRSLCGLRQAGALVLAASLGGCFQPLYGDHALDGGPNLRGAMSQVTVQQIAATPGTDEARVAVELRNALVFDLTGGGEGARPTYSLQVRITPTLSDIIVDTATTRPSIENYGL